MARINTFSLILVLFISLIFCVITSCGDRPSRKSESLTNSQMPDSISENEVPDDYPSVHALLVYPGTPRPGEAFRILATGGKNIRKAKIIVSGPAGNPESLKSRTVQGLPYFHLSQEEDTT